VTARTGVLLKIALALLFLLGPHQLWVPGGRQVSSTGAGKTDARRILREPAGSKLGEVSLTSAPQRGDDVYDAVDLYGNEVTAAVATYELDGSGELYELHSPQTELPQLAPPKS
jgi:hypothetical protein